jgi:hypothetical protein
MNNDLNSLCSFILIQGVTELFLQAFMGCRGSARGAI